MEIMPTFEYICTCGNETEIKLPMNEKIKKIKCTCGNNMRRIYSPINLMGFDKLGRSK